MGSRVGALFTGDWENARHGPAWAPKATAAQLEQYRANGSRCGCSDCQCFGHYASTRKNW